MLPVLFKRSYLTTHVVNKSMSVQDSNVKQQKRPANLTGFGLVMGAGIGAALGVVFDNIGVFVGVGAGLGIVFGAALGKAIRDRKPQ